MSTPTSSNASNPQLAQVGDATDKTTDASSSASCGGTETTPSSTDDV